MAKGTTDRAQRAQRVPGDPGALMQSQSSHTWKEEAEEALEKQGRAGALRALWTGPPPGDYARHPEAGEGWDTEQPCPP